MSFLRAMITFFLPILALGLGIWLALVSPHTQRSAEVETDIQRTESLIEALQDRMKSDDGPSDLPKLEPDEVWPSEQGTKDREISKRILSLADQAELDVRQLNQTSVNVGDLEQSGSVIELSGSLKAVTVLIGELERNKPRLFIRSLTLRPDQTRPKQDGQTMISARFVIWGLSVETD